MTPTLRALLRTTTALLLLPATALAQAQDVTVLPTIDVQAQRGQATAPVQGIVAESALGATKTDTPLIETPQAVTVITRDRIEAQAARSVEEAVRYTPGMTTGLSGYDPRFDAFRLRGFDARASQYLNGLRLMRTLGPTSTELYGLERIEIVRGPSSVLYGQSVPGGLINMVSKRPTETAFGEVNLSAGTDSRLQAGFDLGGPLGEGSAFSYRLTGLVRNADTGVDNVPDDRYFIAPALTWRPDNDTRVTLLSSYQYDQGGSPIGLPATGTLYTASGRIPVSRYLGEDSYNRSDVLAVTFGWDIERRLDAIFTFRQNARYTYNRVAYETMYGRSLSGATLSRGALVQRERSETLNLDNGLQADFTTGAVTHKLLAGADARQFWGTYASYFGTAPAINIFNPVYGAAVADPRRSWLSAVDRSDNLGQLGLYLQDQLRWRNWILVAGLRHDWASTEQNSYLTRTRTDQDQSATTGRIALMYAAENGLSPYVSYSTSFDPVIGTNGLTGEAFRPTEGEQYEIGLKYQPPGRQSFLSAALFDLTQSNVTTRTTNSAGASVQVQTGEVNVKGLEVEALAELGGGWQLIGAYTYMLGEITQDSAVASGRTTTGNEGNRPALVPEHMASLFARYRFAEDSPLAGLSLGGGLRYMGNFYGDNANTYRMPAVTLADATIGYDWRNYRLAVNASNIADTRYVASCSSAYYCYYGTGRTVIANLSYRW
ncbi:TonB-dependent siderophore receptor [Roseomonas sp. GC11]|uniref:TonB-dependent siderophore receptor n=1 Tax=Roseomonas sp. GC11 TaxID=2950546 RepID=UPI00210EC246|nr:TonB-dependent siderophore receptor [Roseomonas sp. GC11]MCQ4160307.1 TonB-dependent siderophore receptor [Roseomonas sp. GC11]